MYESIILAIIALISGVISSVVTFIINKRKYVAEISTLQSENDTIKNQNNSIIYETWNVELKNMKDRLTTLIEESAKERIELNKQLEESKSKIQCLEKKVELLVEENSSLRKMVERAGIPLSKTKKTVNVK